MSLFEGYERRIAQIEKCCKEYGIANIEEADKICNTIKSSGGSCLVKKK